jgi:outer membrane lipoprotein SlyB
MSRTLALALFALLSAVALVLSACGPTLPDADTSPLAGAGPARSTSPSDLANTAEAEPVRRAATPRTQAHPAANRAHTAYPDRVDSASSEAAVRAPSAVLGRVTSVETLLSPSPPNSGAGAVIGGVLGGVLGHQVGGGNGNTAATVLGAVGGAVAGNSLEKTRSRDVIGYRVHVQLDNGQTRQVTVSQPSRFSTGERVRFVGDQLQAV